MFGKLLKYDFKSIGRFFWIIEATMLGLSLVATVVLRIVILGFLPENEETLLPILAIFGVLFLWLYLVALILSFAGIDIMLLVRFYKNFFTDEGYLTFTLPVTRRQLFFSKFITGMLFILLHGALFVICLAIVLFLGIPSAALGGETFFSIFFTWVGSLWDQIGIWLPIYVLEAILALICITAFSISMYYCCFTLGAVIAKKAKVVAAIGIYYAINTALSLIGSFFGTFGLSGILTGLPSVLYYATPDTAYATYALLILLVCALIATISTTLYCFAVGKLERKLNLA